MIETTRREQARAREDRATRIVSTTRENGAAAPAAGAPASGSASDRILARLSERAGAEGFVDDEDMLFDEKNKNLDLETLSKGFPD